LTRHQAVIRLVFLLLQLTPSRW